MRSRPKPCAGRSKKRVEALAEAVLVHPPAGECRLRAQHGGRAGVYRCPADDRFPVVCVDETSKQLVSETRVPLPPTPSQPVRYDYEYRRNGVCNLFMITAPKQGWRTKLDFAAVLRDLTDVHFPEAEKVVLVCDNLNTHHPSVL